MEDPIILSLDSGLLLTVVQMKKFIFVYKQNSERETGLSMVTQSYQQCKWVLSPASDSEPCCPLKADPRPFPQWTDSSVKEGGSLFLQIGFRRILI